MLHQLSSLHHNILHDLLFITVLKKILVRVTFLKNIFAIQPLPDTTVNGASCSHITISQAAMLVLFMTGSLKY
jgi:hypothetical protein